MRAASGYVLPTIRSWVSTTASATNDSHSAAQNRENREAAVVRKLAEPVGEVVLPLPAQPSDAMRRDLVEEAFRNREAPEVLEAVQQPVGVGRITARLELPEPDEPRHAGVDRLFEQMLEVAPQPGRHPLGDAGLDAAFRVDEHIGAEALDRRRGRQDGPRAPAGFDEPPDQVLVAQRVVLQQVRLALPKGNRADFCRPVRTVLRAMLLTGRMRNVDWDTAPPAPSVSQTSVCDTC